MPYKGIFASSTDATGMTPSLTISSGIQMLIGIGVTVAIIKGVDPAIATSDASTIQQAVQNIVAQWLAVLPALYSAYHSMQFIWGFVRKWFPRVPSMPNLPPFTPVSTEANTLSSNNLVNSASL